MHQWKGKLSSHVKAWVIFQLTWASNRKKYNTSLVIHAFRDAAVEENFWVPFIFSIVTQWTNATTEGKWPPWRWRIPKWGWKLGSKTISDTRSSSTEVGQWNHADETLPKWLGMVKLWAANPGISNGFWLTSVTRVKMIPIVDGHPQGRGGEKRVRQPVWYWIRDGEVSMNSCLAWYIWITYEKSFSSMCSRICTCCSGWTRSSSSGSWEVIHVQKKWPPLTLVPVFWIHAMKGVKASWRNGQLIVASWQAIFQMSPEFFVVENTEVCNGHTCSPPRHTQDRGRYIKGTQS